MEALWLGSALRTAVWCWVAVNGLGEPPSSAAQRAPGPAGGITLGAAPAPEVERLVALTLWCGLRGVGSLRCRLLIGEGAAPRRSLEAPTPG